MGTMNIKPKNQIEPRKITESDIQKALEDFDWQAHWKRVMEKVELQSQAYAIARAKSREQACRRRFYSNRFTSYVVA